MRLLPLAVAAMFTGACSSGSPDAVVPPVDHDAQGSWAESTNGVFPGNSFFMSLEESGGVVTGAGTFAGEAGPRGSLAVNGGVAHESLELTIVYVADPALFPHLTPDTAHFVGALKTRDRIDGTLTRRGLASAFSLTRLLTDPR